MRNLVLFSATLIFLNAGCSRKNDRSSLTIGLPPASITSPQSKAYSKGISAFSTATLKHVIVNLSGPGLSPILRPFDAEDPSQATAFTNREFVIADVPRGTDRLIQVLAVYEDDSSGSFIFYYGDVSKTLAAADETADILILPLGGAVSSISGQIMGRYLTGEQSGPTGPLNIKFSPGAGRPEMIIEKSQILNGWFSVFGLSNVPFKYEVASTGEVLFGGPVALNNPIFDPNQNSGAEWSRRVRAAIPVSIRPENGAGGVTTLKPEEASHLVWGFWGNAAAISGAMWSTRSVCKDNLSGSLSRLRKFDVTPANWATQPALNVSNYINVGLTLPSDADLLNQVSPLAQATFLGGEYGPCPTGANTAADEFSKYLKVTKSLIDGNGKDSAAGFRGPFRVVDPIYNQYLSFSFSGLRTISGVVLPGIPDIVKGFRLFKKTGVTDDYRLENPECNSLPAGFVPAGEGPIALSNPGTGTFTITSTISDSDAQAKTAAVICAIRNDTSNSLYGSGIFIGSYAFPAPGAGGGGAAALPAATKLKISFPTSPGDVVYNTTCVPAMVQAVTDAGTPAMRDPTDLTLTISGTAGESFSYNPDCSGTIAFPYTTTIGEWGNGNSLMFYYQNVGSGSGTSSITASTGMLPSYAPVTVSFSDAPGSATHLRFVDAPAAIRAFECYHVWAQSVIGSAGVIAANNGASVTATLTSTSNNIKFYNDGGCTNESTDLIIGGAGYYSTTVPKFFKYVATTSASTAIGASGLWGGAAAVPVTYSSIQMPSVPNRYQIRMPNTLTLNGGCNSGSIELTDASGNPTPLLGALGAGVPATITLNGGGFVTFYASSSCTGATSAVGLPDDNVSTSVPIWYQGTTLGAGSVSASSGSYVGSLPVTVSPP